MLRSLVLVLCFAGVLSACGSAQDDDVLNGPNYHSTTPYDQAKTKIITQSTSYTVQSETKIRIPEVDYDTPTTNAAVNLTIGSKVCTYTPQNDSYKTNCETDLVVKQGDTISVSGDIGILIWLWN